ncbi:GSK3-beta interaction protein-like Protein [Tribolium castaneum]|uniref:GSK3-beta interaction protein-like Protein n=1 Tax=Tribolium castaneum TaxID=7070 RepID=D6WHI5_TRICA|nr:PREDICTED: GSK3-beta interaction protein [Tribolium castaneum]EFA00669.1 GSK3-beta interaction protein-like Protein [Tribolium castaneum]|eukprot:XP_975432.1 PREDICTED: GSK3-beta interaction protein [Tribolium castaneum]
MTERVLDAENWKLEANAVLKDIEKHVKSVKILDGTDQRIYFNLTTIEGLEFCIELSGLGFRVAGTRHNDRSGNSEDVFETPYSLLNQISPRFHESFGNELIKRLNELNH